MQFTKWVRKNRQPIMVVVVILLMIVFVGDIGLRQILTNFGQRGMKQAIATYGDGQKITRMDLSTALQELEVLKNLSAEQFLFSKQSPLGMPDVNAQLLGYLLFRDTQVGARLRSQLRQYSLSGQISVGVDAIDSFFSQQMENGDIYWVLLNDEARKAGIAISNQQSANFLKEFVAQITNNRGDAAFAVRRLATQMNLSEVDIIAIFGKMLGILKWAECVSDNQNVTLAEISSMIGRMSSPFDVSYATFAAKDFVKTATVSDEQITAQFNAYKSFAAGDVSQANPYGFGYLLPKRVQLEYFVINTNDVKGQTQKPTADEAEEYYTQNISRYRTEEPKEPNNPDGEKVTKTKSFAEVASEIIKTLEQERTEKLTQLIFKDARDMIDAETINLNLEAASLEQLSKAAGDYQAIAAKITSKYNVPVLVGKTGLLSQEDFTTAPCLSGLQIQHAGLSTRLAEAVFAARAEANGDKPKLGAISPRLWETIGPMEGYNYSAAKGEGSYVSVLCRVVDVKPAGEPETVDTVYNTAGIAFDKGEADQQVFDLKKQVSEDVQKLAAMDTAKARAEEFKQLVAKSNWDAAIKDYNAKYGPKDPNKPEPTDKTLRLETMNRQVLGGQSDLQKMRQIMQDDPSRAKMVRMQLVRNDRNTMFHNLLGDKTATGIITESFEFKPDLSYYVVKEVTLKSANTEDYLNSKGYAAMRAAMTDASAMGLVHLNPANIQKRLNYVAVNRESVVAPGKEESAEETQE